MKLKRIQRQRVKGWRMPEGAVYVGRPTVFGNPWTYTDTLSSGLFVLECIPEVNVKNFRHWLTATPEQIAFFPIYQKLEPQRQVILARLPELRGKDLACWCPLGKPCHADVLIELANK